MAITDERDLWLPPRSMQRYQRSKTLGGLLFLLIFLGWMLIQWSAPAMRWTAVGLMLVTCWVTVISVVRDHRRSRNRQLRIDGGSLRVSTPTGGDVVTLADVAEARWDDGLDLLDRDGRRLTRLDDSFLADEDEARSFLGWMRQRSDVRFPVRWSE